VIDAGAYLGRTCTSIAGRRRSRRVSAAQIPPAQVLRVRRAAGAFPWPGRGDARAGTVDSRGDAARRATSPATRRSVGRLAALIRRRAPRWPIPVRQPAAPATPRWTLRCNLMLFGSTDHHHV
jgi:hypothetical protein